MLYQAELEFHTDLKPTMASAQDSQRNLYVLNLPLGVTNSELAELFAQYGEVQHSVILAMFDSQARRRGFVDMQDASAAKAALEALNGYKWLGYVLEVSYAIVQRSDGPFSSAISQRTRQRLGDLAPSVWIRNLHPVAVIDADDVVQLVRPYVECVRVVFPDENRDLNESLTVRVILASISDIETLCTALDGVQVHGQTLQVFACVPSDFDKQTRATSAR